jgi:putative glycosyltransferase (TIGR04372 family)
MMSHNINFHTIKKKSSLLLNIIIKVIYQVPFYFIALPVVLIIRIIRPIKLFRFGYFISERIGHLSFDVEASLIEKKLNNQKVIDLFFLRGNYVANEFFIKLSKRHLTINKFVKYLYHLNNMFPWGEVHRVLNATEIHGSRLVSKEMSNMGPMLKFNESENNQGYAFFDIIKKPKNSKFVCLMVRDSAYLNSDYFNYHDYRDSDINDYVVAVNNLLNKGYWVFRMGKIVNEKLLINHPRFLDYANSVYRNDFLDVWLAKNCFFAISTSCGWDSMTEIFKKPICYVNALPLGAIKTAGNNNSIWLSKKLKFKKNNKPLSLNDQIKTGALLYFRSKDYKDNDIIIEDNSSSEIDDAVNEMHLKLNNLWVSNKNDLTDNSLFWNKLSKWNEFSRYHGDTVSRLSDIFLRKNKNWFLD